MKILIADDDMICRSLLESALEHWDHEVVVAEDGREALSFLQQDNPPSIAILDWQMPHISGPELCRIIRKDPAIEGTYTILLTSLSGTENVISGLEAGADDYMNKPFHQDELLARLSVGTRILQLQNRLQSRITDLEKALAEVKTLKNLLPVCAYCQKIRNDENYWQELSTYVTKECDTKFSHGICPTCFEDVVQPELAAFKQAQN